MTDKEIIKALECCADESIEYCQVCPYMINTKRCGQTKLCADALDLINRQQEQLDAAANGQETLQKALAEKDREAELLTTEKEQLIKTFGECQTEATRALAEKYKEIERLNNNISAMAITMHNCAKETRAEAIREFVGKLEESLGGLFLIHHPCVGEAIDNLVKEMTEVDE